MENLILWLRKHPTIILNLIFLLAAASIFLFQLIRPIDVLQDWKLELAPAREYRVIDGRRLAVFNPNESMIFTSTSRKVASASGNTTRSLICEPTQDQDEREILLDILPATKDIGFNPERASSIILPDVVQFNRLPRICKLTIDITYVNVSLWRNHSEHAETEPFIVEELQLTAQEIRDQLQKLYELIDQLEAHQRELGIEPTQHQTTVITLDRPTPQPIVQQPITEQPANENQQPSLVPSLINGATDTINGLLRR